MLDYYYRIYSDTTLSWKSDISHRYYDIYMKRPDYGNYKWCARSYTNNYRLTQLTIKADVLWNNTSIEFAVLATDYGGEFESSFEPSVSFKWEPPESYLSNTPRELN